MFRPSSPKCLRSPSTALTLPSLPPLAISPFPPHLISRRTFSLPLYPLQCSCKFAWMYPWRPKASPLGFGRPPPLPAMSRCPPGPRESAPSADLVWPRTNAQRMLAGSARTYAPRYAHLNMPFALPKIDVFRCVPRPTTSSWLRSPWVPMAALRFDCAHRGEAARAGRLRAPL